MSILEQWDIPIIVNTLELGFFVIEIDICFKGFKDGFTNCEPIQLSYQFIRKVPNHIEVHKPRCDHENRQ